MPTKSIKKPEFKPKKNVNYRTFEEYKKSLLEMSPFQFSDHYGELRMNIVNCTICPDMVRAFEFVKPIQFKKLDIAIKERNAEHAAASAAPVALTEEEKLVASGSHKWFCETEKCGGKGQVRQVWSVVPVE